MDLSSDLDPKIIAINPNVGSELAIRLQVEKRHRECSGRHIRVTVDAKERTVRCEDCGFYLDPFDYLHDWAVEGDRRMSALKSIQIQAKVAQAEHDRLMVQVKNLRRRLKVAGEPQPEDERHQFDVMRWNPHLAEKLLKGETA